MRVVDCPGRVDARGSAAEREHAAQAGIPDHKTIGDDCVIMPQAGVTRDLPPKSYVGGSPAEPRKEFINGLMQIKRIRTLARTIKELGQRLDALERR